MQNTAISLANVNKWFDNFHVLKDINLTVNTGEKVVICGPSGSGKSTVVRCINKLEEHQSGLISFYGKELKNTQESINSIQGNVGMVFQQFNLFRVSVPGCAPPVFAAFGPSTRRTSRRKS